MKVKQIAIVLLVCLVIALPTRAQAAWPTLEPRDLPPGEWGTESTRVTNDDICKDDAGCKLGLLIGGRQDGMLAIFFEKNRPGSVLLVQEIELFDTPQHAQQSLSMDCMMFPELKSFAEIPNIGDGGRLCELPPSNKQGGYFLTWLSFSYGRMHITLATWGNIYNTSSSRIKTTDLMRLATILIERIGIPVSGVRV